MDLDTIDPYEQTLLTRAVTHHKLNIIIALIHCGANPDLLLENKTALMLVVHGYGTNICITLLQAKVNSNTVNTIGDTALMYAVSRSNFGLVEQLIAFKADVRIRNHNNESVLDLVDSCSQELVHRLIRHAIITAMCD